MAHTLFACGTEENAGDTVIVFPDIAVILLDSIVPSWRTTDNVAEFSVVKSVLFSSSTIICVVETPVFIRPPLLMPALIESAIPIIEEGLIKTPASRVVVNLTVSHSLKLVYKNHLPRRFAWPLDVHAKLFIVFLTVPYFATESDKAVIWSVVISS